MMLHDELEAFHLHFYKTYKHETKKRIDFGWGAPTYQIWYVPLTMWSHYVTSQNKNVIFPLPLSFISIKLGKVVTKGERFSII